MLMGAVRRGRLRLIYTRVHRIWALVYRVGLVLGPHMVWDLVRLLKRPLSRASNGKRLVTTQWRPNGNRVVIYLGWCVGGMNILIRRICRESTFVGIMMRPHWLIDRALENLPRLQVQGHRVDIGLTLNGA